jgi:glycosyltransferase involved in cell wall biosynthesis
MKVVIRGVRSQSGFGVATIGLIRLLSAAGHDTRFIPLTQDVGQDSIGLDDSTLRYLDSISIDQNDAFIKNSTFIEVGSLIFGYNCGKPSGVDRYILYTTTETTTINTYYSEAYNTKFDELWTASKFNKASLFCSGVNIPINVLPHLVDTGKFIPELKPYNIKNKRAFNFIVNIDFSYRKGLHLLLPAWMKAFNRDDDVSLILKVSDGNFKDPTRPITSLNELLFKLNYVSSDNAPILVIPNMISERLIPNLYTTGDVYIAPTLGEGFGFPIAESMACEVPPIVSNASAPSEYVTNKDGLLIDLNTDAPVQPITDESLLRRDQNYKGRYLYNLSEDSLYTQLQTAVNMSKDELNTMGQHARQTIINKFSFEPLIKTLNELLGV